MVPLGKAIVSGLVVDIEGQSMGSDTGTHVRSQAIRDILSLSVEPDQHPIDAHLLELVKKVAEYYLAPFAACLRLVVPSYSGKVVRRVFLTEKGQAVLSDGRGTMEEQTVLQRLKRRPQGLLRTSLLRGLSKASSLLDRLKRKDWIIEKDLLPAEQKGNMAKSSSVDSQASLWAGVDIGSQARVQKDSQDSVPCDLEHPPRDVKLWVDSLEVDQFREVPVVGSDEERQEKLLHLVARVRALQRNMLILSPEVQHAEALGKRLKAIWGEEVEVLHGQLSTSLRAHRVERIRRGQVKIVVGTRSALFLPIQHVGLIWVDQEEAFSYKEEQLPYYHAREVARMRGTIEQAPVVYGSFRPSLELYARFSMAITHASDVPECDLEIQVVDLRTLPFGTLLSPVLIDSMSKALQAGEQAILFLNRKGWSSALVCEDCGQASTCEMCQIPFKLYQRPARLVCSYGHGSHAVPEVCPNCQGRVFRFSGVGTQRLEEEVGRVFPGASLGRLDGEMMKESGTMEEILQRFRDGDLQILIGTELLCHQIPLPRASVLGFPQADMGLHFPDFHSGERTFQVLSRALMLSRCGNPSSSVILQTSMPDHHVIRAIHEQEMQVFYTHEQQLRELLGYPPTTHVVLLFVIGPKMDQVQRVADMLRDRLQHSYTGLSSDPSGQGARSSEIFLGPMESKQPGKSQKRRIMFMMKTETLDATRQRLQGILKDLGKRRPKDSVIIEVNVDPIQIQ